MRSPTRARSRSCCGRSAVDLLEATSRLVDESCVGADTHVLVHLTSLDGDELELGLLPLGADTHPFDELAGFTAPERWSAFGVRALGQLRHLDEPDRSPEHVASTFLVDRDGTELSLNRVGHEVQVLSGRGEGIIPDTCRRVLGLPTRPAPPSSSVVWTLAWLDRLLELWGRPTERRRITSCWAELARQHPACEGGAPRADDLADPAWLVRLGREHSDAWTWERLRHEPARLQLPHDELSGQVTRWMDDGFYARWAVGSYPPIHTLATELPALLGEPLGSQLIGTALALLDDHRGEPS